MIDKIRKIKDKDNNTTYVVGGYKFKSEEAAQEAKDEMLAIKYMCHKIDANDPAQIYLLYNRILDRDLFRTAVGLDYLKKFQQFLYLSKSIPNEKIKPIPINQDLQEVIDGKREVSRHKSKVRELERESAKYKNYYARSMVAVIALVIMIIAMVIITVTGTNPNIINYENKLQDRYASWEEELSSREAVVRQKEHELNIQR